MRWYLFRRLIEIICIGSLITLCAPVFANVHQELAKLEATSGGRLGVVAINTGNNSRIQYRAHERFPMGCTSKVMGVAAVLKKSMSNPDLLHEKITLTKKDATNWMPITGKHLNNDMTIEELSAAAISYSDNTAMNLLLTKIGGPQGMTQFARSIGDKTFRQDRSWPDEALAGPEGLDSTTPAAMASSLQKLALGNALAQPQREQLQAWLRANTTGNTRIRAGVPKGWFVGDKTGTGFNYGTTNDIAIIWPPNCAPIVVAIYYTSNHKNARKRPDTLASATRLIIKDFALSDSCI